MTTAWHHAHPANQRPVLKACLKKQSQTGSFHSSKSKERGGRKELNKKGSLGICGHWKLWESADTGKYKHRHWNLWTLGNTNIDIGSSGNLRTLGNINTDTGSSGNLRTLGNINTDTGSSGNLRTLGNTNTDTGSSQNPWTVGNTNTYTHVHECTHRLLYKCSSDVHMHNAAYKHRFQANAILQSLDTHTLNTKKTDTIIPR